MTKPTMPTKPTKPRSPKTSTSVRVAVYTRVGCHRDAYLLRIQEAAIEAFLASGKIRECMRVDEVYQDVGLPGDTLDRPGLQRLLQDIRAGKVGCVVVHTLDRLGRDAILFAAALPMFLEPGVILVTVDPVDYKGVFPKGKRGKFAGLMERAGGGRG
jgi:DNA invertase Pin-like site-specific DNA recombinase